MQFKRYKQMKIHNKIIKKYCIISNAKTNIATIFKTNQGFCIML